MKSSIMISVTGVYFTKESAKVKAAIENVSEIKEAVVGTFKVQLEGAETQHTRSRCRPRKKNQSQRRKHRGQTKSASRGGDTEEKPEKKDDF